MASARAFCLSRLRGACALASAALLLAVLFEQAPHTIHHLLDHDAHSQPECELATADERGQGVCGVQISLDPPSDTALPHPGCRRGTPPAQALIPSDARAPPPFIS